jgi:peptidoglycan/LPS O-acetylase OafA/YrhL
MSGFVMCYVYAGQFRDGVGWRDYRHFILARFARIYPVNLLSLLLLLALLLPVIWHTDKFLSYDGRYSWQAAIASLFLLQGPAIDHRTWNFPSWSVSVEWVLYFLFPFCLPLFRRRYLALAALPVLGLLAFLLYTTAGPVTNGPLSLVHGLLLFLSGIAVYELSKLEWFSSAILLAATLAGMIVLAIHPALEMLAVFLVPLLVLTIIQNRHARAVLSTAVFRWLGSLSYSLYMLHALVAILLLSRIQAVFVHLLGEGVPAGFATMAVSVALSLLLAAVSLRFVEKPLRSWIRTLSDRAPRRPLAEQALQGQPRLP